MTIPKQLKDLMQKPIGLWTDSEWKKYNKVMKEEQDGKIQSSNRKDVK